MPNLKLNLKNTNEPWTLNKPALFTQLHFFRPVRVIRFISEETIEEGIYSIAQEKLKLEQDLVNSDEDPDKLNDTKKKKKDVSRLLRLALDVDIAENELGDVTKVYTDTETSKTFVELQKKNKSDTKRRKKSQQPLSTNHHKQKHKHISL